MKWTQERKEELTRLWNQGKDDAYIANCLKSTQWGVGRMRSQLGLVKYQVATHTRAKKAVTEKRVCPPQVLYYTKDGQPHFMGIEGLSNEQVDARARVLMYQQNIRQITVLEPKKVFKMSEIEEIIL